MIDLRSDTVTLPSPEMRAAMAAAEVGDDVYGEDPSVNALEARAAAVLGKAAAVYVPTGTMGNLCAHLAHTRAGQEVICSEHAHTFVAEAAGPARVAGLQLRALPQRRAELDPQLVEAAIRPKDPHYPETGLIWVEQPTRGYAMPLDNLAAIAAIGRRRGIPIHMDGARVFNAAVYLGVPVSAIAGYVDSVMFCISKGLAAPVGSLLVGDADFIDRARRARKMVGGSMRQAGIIASAGLIALDHADTQLKEDLDNARLLAGGLRRLPGIEVDREEIQTNIFFVKLTADSPTPQEFAEALKGRGILVSAPRAGGRVMRLVTHHGVTCDDIATVLRAVGEVLAAGAPARRAELATTGPY